MPRLRSSPMNVDILKRVFACIIFLGAVTVLLLRGVHVHTSLYDLLPTGGDGGATQLLERMARTSSRQVNVLIKGTSEQEVLERARQLTAALPEGVRPITDQSSLGQVCEFLRPYRFQLLSPRHRSALQQGDTQSLCDEALANLYSFVPLSLYPVDEDPYGFATSFLLENPLVRQNGFEPRDCVLMTSRGGVHYAYLPLLLPEAAADSLDVLQSHMAAISAACQGPGILLCGTPVHTWRASSSSQQAMGVLSILSLVIVVALFLWVFTSVRGMLIMSITLGIAGVVALGAAVLIHGSVHILSLVFGCSLVGISTDYIVHYLVGHHGEQNSAVSPALRRSLLLGLLTSTIGYSTFYVAQVDLLGQIATVSIAGLAASMLFIFAFYPQIYRKAMPIRLVPGALKLGDVTARWQLPAWLPWCVAACAFIFAVFLLPVCDDLRSFYRPEPALLEAEKELAQLNGMEQGMVTLVVRGADAEEILQRQEELGAALTDAGIPFYTSASAIVPSAARQKENFELVKNLVAAYAEDVPVEMPDTWPGPLLPEHLLRADSPFVSLGSLWGDGCGLVLVPGKYGAQLNSLPQYPWMEQADRFAELQNQVRQWREQLMVLMGVVLGLVLTVLSIYFGIRSALHICGPVFAGVLCVFGGLALFGVPLTLFHVLACYLVLGLGCDYAIFRATHERSCSITALAVLISFLTSWSVFGVLAFTNFSVTQDMGIAVSLGLTVAYVLSPAATGAAVRPCKALCESRK